MGECLGWLTQDLADVPEGDDWLGEREREILSGLHFSKRRNDWRLGRWTAKCACRAFKPDIVTILAQMEIIAADDGGPGVFLAGGEPAAVSLSISHSNNRGYCTVAPEGLAVGCDLERIQSQSIDFFEDYFTAEELQFCRSASGYQYPIACYLVWSAKESSLKILREGLRRDTRSIQIQADFPAEVGVWNAWTGHCRITSRVFNGWWRHEDGFVYTLGSDEIGARLELHQLVPGVSC